MSDDDLEVTGAGGRVVVRETGSSTRWLSIDADDVVDATELRT